MYLALKASPLPCESGRPSTIRSKFVLLIVLLVWSFCVKASPWIEAGSAITRHHLQTLVDSGVMDTVTTSWPLMWHHIKEDLDQIDPTALTDEQLWSYQYLRHELRKAMRVTSFEQKASAGSAATTINDFSTTRREQYESELTFNYTGQRSAFHLDFTYAHDPLDDKSVRFDGTYWNYLVGNWAVGIGAVDRWWGPGWDSSLILSHNARPAPGLFVQRNSSQAFESPWLSWLGPWQLVTFMSQLEEDRHVPDARLWGMRLNIKPLKSLEIGFSRTAMWGGDNRPGDLDTFLNLLLGKDNRGDGGIAEDTSNEPGNQLAGIDLRWSVGLGNITGGFYGQLIGEDEAGGMPSRHIGMAGVELQGLWHRTHARFSFEAQNTAVYFYESAKTAPNVAYEHSIYRSGYRYYGRPIGSSVDNDAEAFMVRGQFHFQAGDYLNLSYGKFRLNHDGTNVSPPGGNIFGEQTTTERIQLTYSRPITSVVLLELGAFHYTSPIHYAGEEIDSGGHLSVHTYW